jgi:hypothetical protein
MKNLLNIILFLFFFHASSISQIIEVNDKIIMTNTSEDLRKVKGLGTPENETEVISDQFFLSGQINYAVASGTNDTLHLTIYPFPIQIEKGFIISFLSPIENMQIVVAEVNGNSIFYEIKKKAIISLDSADIMSGQLVSMIFDGTNFQIINEIYRKCPSGFIKVTDEYCITPNEPANAYFWKAIRECGKKSARVCSYGEWYYACLNQASLGITNMTGNFEWVDGGGNSLGWTTPVTSNTGLMLGNTSCTDVTSSITDSTHTHSKANPKPYRCCYSLIR